MAAALARSFRVWHDSTGLTLFIATDAPGRFPQDLQEASNVEFVDIGPRDFGVGFENKLHIDELLPARRTLFIDADCLLTRPLDPVFDAFEGHSVSVVGGERAQGEWFGDLQARCERFGVSGVPVFVGAVYYVEDDETAGQVFSTARSVKKKYDEMGFVRLRGLPNEEPLISVGMAVHDQKPIPDDGTIKADAMHFQEMQIDVLEGTSRFRGSGEKITAWDVTDATPTIAHFNDSFAEKLPYIREQKKLEKIFADGYSRSLASVYSVLAEAFPFRVAEETKDVLRPLYHALWGPREIRNKRAE
jgi:hypothetical protein